jgi:hypothetical protein
MTENQINNTVPIYTPEVYTRLKEMPTLKNMRWLKRLILCFIPARMIGVDTDGQQETIVWGKRLNGVMYITGYSWSQFK